MLGDVIERALSSVGITPARVSAWLGKPCGCAERKARLNSLTWWAQRTLNRKADPPPGASQSEETYLENLLTEGKEEPAVSPPPACT